MGKTAGAGGGTRAGRTRAGGEGGTRAKAWRLGDFVEMQDADARRASQVLDMDLGKRLGHDLLAVPYQSWNRMKSKLQQAGIDAKLGKRPSFRKP